MKKWNAPLVEELNIEDTACGWWDTKPAPGPGGPGHGGPQHIPGGPVGGPGPIPGAPIGGSGPIPGGLPGDEVTDGLS